MPEYLLSEETLNAHVQTSIKYDYCLLSLYVNFITGIVRSSDCKQIWIAVNGHNALRRKWRIYIIIIVVVVIVVVVVILTFTFCFVHPWLWKAERLCNVGDELECPSPFPLAPSSWPRISFCYLSNNEQTQPLLKYGDTSFQIDLGSSEVQRDCSRWLCSRNG